MTPLCFDVAALTAGADALSWAPLGPGVDIHVLYQLGHDGPKAALLRYAPGARVARHAHDGVEHILVLAGAQHDERGRYGAGSFVVNPPGSEHSVWSPEGCLVLITWARPVRFV